MPPDSAFMRQRLAMHGASRLKLGLFGANCSSGRAVTTADERWTGSWPDNLRLARLADEAGIDFMLPIARWKGYGGTTDYQGTTLETFTWATGLLANTKRLTVFGTVHAPLIHPVIAAKACVTADHVGEGRFGLNVVCGWNEGEFEMFGVTQRDHEQRYAYAREWLDAVKAMWSREDEFDFDGEFIRLKRVRAKPKPYRGTRPMIMNAGASPTGQDFAIHNCDALFSTPAAAGTLEEFAQFIQRAKGVAAQNGRDLDIYTVGVVTCRPTASEAKEYYRACVQEQADWGAVDSILAMRKVTPASVSPEEYERLRRHTANGLGGLPMIGTPDDVAEEMAKLSAAGVRGIGLSLINYADELPYFCAEVLPRLQRKGLRVPVSG